MKIGKKFALIEILSDTELNGAAVTIDTPNADYRYLKVAIIEKIAVDCPADVSVGDVVVVDDALITYWIDDVHCCIELSGILCRYNTVTHDCYDFKHAMRTRSLVVKMSIPTDDVMLRNIFVQNGLVVIGGAQSNSDVALFDVPVAITASPESVKHLITNSGDYYITTDDNIILTFDVMTQRP